MASWLPATLLSLLSFGVWGLFSKMAVLHIDSRSSLVFQSIGFFTVGMVMLAILNFRLPMQVKGTSFGLLSGVASSIGCMFFLFAADKGKIITVATMTALYPLVTVLLSILVLHETMGSKQCLGIVFALVAIYFLTSG